MFHDLLQDVRYGLRQLRASPKFAAAAIIVLALGIGANTTIFSAIDAVFFRPLPFVQPERLVSIDAEPPSDMGRPGPRRKTYPDLLDFRADTAAFASVASYATGGLNLAGGAEPIRATITYVSDQFFETLGRGAMLGRTPIGDEHVRDGPRVIVLSFEIWQRLFDGDAGVLGKTVALNDRPYTVVGVMPRGFRFPNTSDAWIAFTMPVGRDVFEAFRNYIPAHGIARLAPGVSVATAAQHIDVVRRRFKPEISPKDPPVAELAKPFRATLVGDRKSSLVVLMGSAALLLLIACANVTNLLLSRASSRQREMAVRVALGATRGRVIRQVLVEQALLAAAGAVIAAVVARLSLSALMAVLPPAVAGITPPTIDGRVLAFTTAVALVTTVLVGLIPAIGSARLDAGDTLKAPGASTGKRRGRARALLIVAEVSLALVLVVGAALMIESLRVLLRTDVGLDAANVATARLVLPRAKYQTIPAKAAFYDAVVERLRAMPGVQSAGAVNALPLDGVGVISIRVAASDDLQDDAHSVPAAMLQATPGYFKTLGVPLIGSDLPAVADTARRVAVVNRALAEKLWPGENPIGKTFGWADMKETVIGVVGDVRTTGLDRSPQPQMYTPLARGPQDYGALAVRGALPVPTLLGYLRQAVAAVDAAQPLYELRSMEEVVERSVAPRRTNTILLTTFGALALVLAAVGVYAVLSYGVAQRTREIGVRMALGAQRRDVLALVVREGLLLATLGIAIGLVGAYALSRTLGSMLYQVNPHDVRIFVTAPVVLAIVALVATLAPALRATRVDPMAALREG